MRCERHTIVASVRQSKITQPNYGINKFVGWFLRRWRRYSFSFDGDETSTTTPTNQYQHRHALQQWFDIQQVDVSIQFVDRSIYAEPLRTDCFPPGWLVLVHRVVALRLRLLERLCRGLSAKYIMKNGEPKAVHALNLRISEHTVHALRRDLTSMLIRITLLFEVSAPNIPF